MSAFLGRAMSTPSVIPALVMPLLCTITAGSNTVPFEQVPFEHRFDRTLLSNTASLEHCAGFGWIPDVSAGQPDCQWCSAGLPA
jgi:hypothetical protein